MQTIICKIDGKEFTNGGVFARYLKKTYGLTYREYYHKYIICSDEVPKCKCGCGQDLPWTTTGYREMLKGHYSRIHNNWGHNPKAVEKSAQTRREQFANGERTVWNDGLTIEDERVRNNGQRISESFSVDRKAEYSKKMTKMWEDKSIVARTGEDSPNWKGGISPVNIMCRTDRRLFKEWTYPILVRDGFKCTKCGNTKDLQVHHDKETFASILKKLVTIEDLEQQEDFERKKLICEKVTNYHVDNSVSGVTLCFDCHKEIHPSLNL